MNGDENQGEMQEDMEGQQMD
jgi:hypothetical protein